MSAIKIGKISQSRSGDVVEISTDLLIGEKSISNRMSIETEYNLGIIPPEFSLLSIMPRAIFNEMDIHTDYELDPVFISGIGHYINRITSEIAAERPEYPDSLIYDWTNSFRKSLKYRPLVTCNQCGSPSFVGIKDKIALMFSGGIDSFYTLMTRKEISDIIFITDMNTPDERVLSVVKTLFPKIKIHKVRSSTIGIWDRFDSGWYFVSHGCVLYSSGLLFQNVLAEIVISSGERLFNGEESGSGRDIDPLVSTSKIKFSSYGFASKEDKIAQLLSLDEDTKKIVFSNIQVCPCKNNLLNCCNCIKCINTMIMLRECGAEKYSTSFDFSGLEEKIQSVDLYNEFFVHKMVCTARSSKFESLKNASIKWLNKYQEKSCQLRKSL